MILPVLALLLPGQLNPVAGDMEVAAPAEPPLARVPQSGAIDVARNAAYLTTELLSGVAVVTFEGATEVETPVALETVEGITIARLPLQPALATVTLRLDFQGGFTEDVSWTTGNALIEGPAAPAEIARAEVLRPLLQNPHVEIELAPTAAVAAAALSAVDGDQRARLAASLSWGGGAPIVFADWSYQGGARDYDVVVIDGAGNVADATAVTVAETGCAAAPIGSSGLLALALVAARRGRRRHPRPSSTTARL